MTSRERGGVWVAIVAAAFYPLTWLTRQVHRSSDRIPRQGGALLVLNHVSHFDPVADAVFVHRQKRAPRFMAKDSLLRVPVLGRIVAGTGAIPVQRGKVAALGALRDANNALQAGKLVVVYPEGTITKDPQMWPRRAYAGVARLALETDVPVIPIARWGTQHLLDGYRKRFRPFPRKTVTFNVGRPIDLSAYRDMPQTSAVHREVTDLIMEEVTRLLAEIRGEEFPPTLASRPGSPRVTVR